MLVAPDLPSPVLLSYCLPCVCVCVATVVAVLICSCLCCRSLSSAHMQHAGRRVSIAVHQDACPLPLSLPSTSPSPSLGVASSVVLCGQRGYCSVFNGVFGIVTHSFCPYAARCRVYLFLEPVSPPVPLSPRCVLDYSFVAVCVLCAGMLPVTGIWGGTRPLHRPVTASPILCWCGWHGLWLLADPGCLFDSSTTAYRLDDDAMSCVCRSWPPCNASFPLLPRSSLPLPSLTLLLSQAIVWVAKAYNLSARD